jgi:hypothetical protein
VDGVKWEGDGRVDEELEGKKQSSLFLGSQKGALFFQMNEEKLLLLTSPFHVNVTFLFT